MDMLMQSLDIPIVVVAALASFFSISLIISWSLAKKIRQQKTEFEIAMRALKDDVRILFDTGSGMEKQLDSLAARMRAIGEKQEHFTLHEPGEQAYRTASSLIANGVSAAEAAARSGLSKGEIELLMHLKQAGQNKKAPV